MSTADEGLAEQLEAIFPGKVRKPVKTAGNSGTDDRGGGDNAVDVTSRHSARLLGMDWEEDQQ
jgi:hypothetical protein